MRSSLLKLEKLNGGEMVMRRLLLLALILAVFLSAPFSLHAQQRRVVRKAILDYRDELKLSDEQVEEIKAYLFDLGKKVRELRGKLVLVNREVRALLREGAKRRGSLDLDKVKKKIREAFEIRAEMAIAEIETAEKINGVLTPKQFEKWKEIRSKERMKK